jgi:hypothetical protein
MYTVNDHNIHIENSYTISKYEFNTILNEIKSTSPNNSVIKNRCIISLINEWAVHNLLYHFNIYKTRSASVDLDYPQKWYYTLMYNLIGPIALLLIS